MNSFDNEIIDLLVGETPRQKWQYLKDLISENNRIKGRLDFCKRQFNIIQNNASTDPYTKGYINSILETLKKEI